MGRFGTIMLAGFFLGPSAATPMGLALDLPPLVALIAVLAGVNASFLVALFATERLRAVYARRRATRAEAGPGARWGLSLWWRRWSLLGRLSRRHNWGLVSRWRRRRDRRSGDRAARRARVAKRARAVLVRFGPVGFGLVGPALFGTWVSAAIGTALGLARWRLLTWLVVGATVWTALLVLASSSLFGWLFA